MLKILKPKSKEEIQKNLKKRGYFAIAACTLDRLYSYEEIENIIYDRFTSEYIARKELAKIVKKYFFCKNGLPKSKIETEDLSIIFFKRQPYEVIRILDDFLVFEDYINEMMYFLENA